MDTEEASLGSRRIPRPHARSPGYLSVCFAASPAALMTMIAALEARPDWDGVSCAVELVGWVRPNRILDPTLCT